MKSLMSLAALSRTLWRRTAEAVMMLCLLLIVGCGGGGSGDLGGGLNESTATYLIYDLASGTRTTAMSVPDLVTNPLYRSTSMVFRRVTGLGDSYFLAVFEVTQDQWSIIAPATTAAWTKVPEAVVGNDAIGGNRPAFNISNDDIVAELTDFNVGRNVQLALPSDAQWDFACAAGTTTRWSWGDASERSTILQHAVVAETRLARGPVAVGSFAANPWGFYDFHGNVWEWTGSGSGAHIRGGSWHDSVTLARRENILAGREGIDRSTAHAVIGARLLLRQ